jgi:hypothetical protein
LETPTNKSKPFMSKYNIQRFATSLVIDTGEDADQIISDAIPLNGLLRGILVTSPDLDDTDTFSITIKDAGGYTIYTNASLAESTLHALFEDPDLTDAILARPLSGNHTITITASGDQAADRTFAVILLIER